MERVFLDANVLYSAAFLAENNFLRLWELADVQLITSAYALEEARHAIEEGECRERLERLAGQLHVADVPQMLVVPSFSDPPASLAIELPEKDRPILAGAIALQATHLLTGDLNHFGRYFGQTVRGVLILRPAQYLRYKGIGEAVED